MQTVTGWTASLVPYHKQAVSDAHAFHAMADIYKSDGKKTTHVRLDGELSKLLSNRRKKLEQSYGEQQISVWRAAADKMWQRRVRAEEVQMERWD